MQHAQRAERVPAARAADRPIDLELLAHAVHATRTANPAPVDVTDLAYEARRVTPGALFVCVPGMRADGHDFAAQAIADGAAALIVERELDLSVPLDEYMHYVQPAVSRHPETGRRALYINRLMTHRIEGMPQAESDALIDAVVAYAEDPANIYDHVWRPGDMLMWDNLCSIHARTDFPREERRLMRRFTISGTRVEAAWDSSAAMAV